MISDILSKLESLKKECNAVILAHYYQDPDIQDVADFMGDSLSLAQYSMKTDADFICTLSNAQKKFAPDKYLGAFLHKKTGRDLLLWDSSCQVHEIIS